MEGGSDAPLLSLCMIVKDEAEFLPRCLASVRGVVDEIVVVDTGSSDRTPQVAREFGARVVQAPWTGHFAAARNRSLEEATGEWILFLDADEELHPDDRERVRPLLAGATAEGFLVQLLNYTADGVWVDVELSDSVRIFRNRPEHRFTRGLHEQISASILARNPQAVFLLGGVRVLHYGYLRQVVRAKRKGRRNLPMARREARAMPGDAFAQFNLGTELMGKGQYRQALPAYDTAAAACPRDAPWAPKLVKSRILCLVNLSRDAEAAQGIEDGLRAYPDFTDLVFLRGLLHYRHGRLEQAEADFNLCLSMGPAPVPPHTGANAGAGSYRAQWMLGQVHEAAGDEGRAIEAYRRAHAAHPLWMVPLCRIAYLAVASAGPDTAQGLVEPHFDLQSPRDLVSLAEVFFVAKAYPQALAYLERAEAAGAPPADLAYLRGEALLRSGEYERAIDYFQQVPRDSPRCAQALVDRYYCYLCQDREDGARAVRRRARADERFYAAAADLGLQQALEVLRRALRRFPGDRTLAATFSAVKAELHQEAANEQSQDD